MSDFVSSVLLIADDLMYTGHNSDGKYFVTSNKLTYNCELKPRKVVVFIEKGRDGHLKPINDVEVQDVACGANHTVCTALH